MCLRRTDEKGATTRAFSDVGNNTTETARRQPEFWAKPKSSLPTSTLINASVAACFATILRNNQGKNVRLLVYNVPQLGSRNIYVGDFGGFIRAVGAAALWLLAFWDNALPWTSMAEDCLLTTPICFTNGLGRRKEKGALNGQVPTGLPAAV